MISHVYIDLIFFQEINFALIVEKLQRRSLLSIIINYSQYDNSRRKSCIKILVTNFARAKYYYSIRII